MRVVFVCIVNSTYFSDYLSHVDCVFDSFDKAEAWKKDYEGRVKKNYGMVLPRIKNGSDAELDRYLDVQTELEKAKKFLGCEIKEYKVL